MEKFRAIIGFLNCLVIPPHCMDKITKVQKVAAGLKNGITHLAHSLKFSPFGMATRRYAAK